MPSPVRAEVARRRRETTVFEREVDDAIRGALECGKPSVIDFRVDREEKVYPMVPSGAASSEMIDDEFDNEWVEEGV